MDRQNIELVSASNSGEMDLDHKNLGGWTALMYAAYIGHDNIARLLLENGVSVNAATSKGLTPLMLAASCGNESIASFLLQVRWPLDCMQKTKNCYTRSSKFYIIFHFSSCFCSEGQNLSERMPVVGRLCCTAPAQDTNRW